MAEQSAISEVIMIGKTNSPFIKGLVSKRTLTDGCFYTNTETYYTSHTRSVTIDKAGIYHILMIISTSGPSQPGRYIDSEISFTKTSEGIPSPGETSKPYTCKTACHVVPATDYYSQGIIDSIVYVPIDNTLLTCYAVASTNNGIYSFPSPTLNRLLVEELTGEGKIIQQLKTLLE